MAGRGREGVRRARAAATVAALAGACSGCFEPKCECTLAVGGVGAAAASSTTFDGVLASPDAGVVDVFFSQDAFFFQVACSASWYPLEHESTGERGGCLAADIGIGNLGAGHDGALHSPLAPGYLVGYSAGVMDAPGSADDAFLLGVFGRIGVGVDFGHGSGIEAHLALHGWIAFDNDEVGLASAAAVSLVAAFRL